MYLMDIGFCYKTASIWHTIGYAFFIVKIVVPLIIIILGIIDFTKAVISNDEKEVNKTAGKLIKKIVIGIVIFFIPTIVNAIFKMFGEFIDYSSDFNNCLNCITSPIGKCDTSYAGGIIPENPGNGSFTNDGTSTGNSTSENQTPTTPEKEQAPEPEKEAAPEPEKEPGPIPE